MPRISVIMPVYNGEKYLKKSINSVISQTFTDWELILVNDCSTDSSLSIMMEYVDSRIKIVSNEKNEKLPNSLNIGFSYATGEYLTWTSDDNIYGEHAFERMIAFLDGNLQYGMVYCDMYYIDENGDITGSCSKEVEELYCNDSVGACFLYRAEVTADIGLYDSEMFLVEDYDYWLRLNKKYDIYHLRSKEYYYRRHKESLTQTRRARINEKLYKLRMRELDFLLSRITYEEKKLLFIDMVFQNKSLKESFKVKFFNGVLPEDLMWIERVKETYVSKKKILMGAGEFGRDALELFGKEKVYCFADNNESIVGNEIEGKVVISFEELKKIHPNYQVVIAVNNRKIIGIARQLEKNGITEFAVFLEIINSIM